MKAKNGHTHHFHPTHYLVFIAVLIISFFASYVLFSHTRVVAPEQPQQQARIPLKSPSLISSVVVSGLDHPWDIAFLPNKVMLITERSGTVSMIRDGQKTPLFKPADVVVRGEGGMLGMAVDPEFGANHLIYTCFNSNKSGSPDIRVVAWQLKPDGSGLVARKGDIMTAIPSSSSGRHSGCRIAFGADGNLWIGTGDAANENTPQNMRSLGGKILRVDRNGQAVADNNPPDGADKRIYSWGHRNTQGLAMYASETADSYGVSAEHGSDRDDEVNPLVRGNFGWAPGAGYDESVAMTDTARFPDAIKSLWSSGRPTMAVSGATFVRGAQWGSWQGRLAVGVLKDKHVMLLELNDDGVGEKRTLLDGEYGRLRAVVMGPDGVLYISTDNGSDDKIIKLLAS